MIYVNALADDFKRRNICSLVSHWANISRNAVWIWLTVHWAKWKRTLKKNHNKRNLDEALLILPLILQACKQRDHIYPILSTGAPSLEEHVAQIPPGRLAGGPWEGSNHGDTWRPRKWPITLSIQKAWAKTEKEPVATNAFLHCAGVGREDSSLKGPETSVTQYLCPAAPQPALLVPTAETHLPENKASGYSYSPVICVLCFRQLCQTI